MGREREMREKIKIGGIIQKRNLAKVGVMSIPDRPGVAGAIFSALGAKGINIPFIVHTIDLHNLDNIVICVAQEDLTAALEVLNTVRETVGAEERRVGKGGHRLHVRPSLRGAARHRRSDVLGPGLSRHQHLGYQYFHLQHILSH